MVFWYLAVSNNCLLFLHLNFWCLLTVSSENGYVGTYQVSVWSFPAFQVSQERGNKAGVTEALRTLGKIFFFQLSLRSNVGSKAVLPVFTTSLYKLHVKLTWIWSFSECNLCHFHVAGKAEVRSVLYILRWSRCLESRSENETAFTSQITLRKRG